MSDEIRYKVSYRNGGTSTICLHSLGEALEYKAQKTKEGFTPDAWAEVRVAGQGWTRSHTV